MSVPWIVFATDIVELQGKLRDFVTELGNAIGMCTNVQATGFQEMLADWQDLRNDVVDYISQPPGYFWNEGTQYAEGDVLFQRLQTMSTRVAAMGCTTPPSPAAPNVDGPATPDWLRALQWATVAVVVAASAYGVSQVVQAVPQLLPRPRAA